MTDSFDGFKSDSYNNGNYAFKSKKAQPTPFELKIGRMVQEKWTVLDIGAGSGQFVDFACRKEARVFAIDALEDNREIIQSRPAVAEAKEDGRFNFVLGQWPGCRSKLGSLGFDLIFSQSALHYLSEEGRLQAFRSVYQTMNRGSYFALALKSIDNAWMEKRSEDGQLVLTKTDHPEPRWLNSIDGSLRTFFTVHRLKRELCAAGFHACNHHFETRIVSDYEFEGELSVWIEFLYQKI